MIAKKHQIDREDVKDLMDALAVLLENARTFGHSPAHLLAVLANTLGHVIIGIEKSDEAAFLADGVKHIVDCSVEERRRQCAKSRRTNGGCGG